MRGIQNLAAECCSFSPAILVQFASLRRHGVFKDDTYAHMKSHNDTKRNYVEFKFQNKGGFNQGRKRKQQPDH